MDSKVFRCASFESQKRFEEFQWVSKSSKRAFGGAFRGVLRPCKPFQGNWDEIPRLSRGTRGVSRGSRLVSGSFRQSMAFQRYFKGFQRSSLSFQGTSQTFRRELQWVPEGGSVAFQRNSWGLYGASKALKCVQRCFREFPKGFEAVSNWLPF